MQGSRDFVGQPDLVFHWLGGFSNGAPTFKANQFSLSKTQKAEELLSFAINARLVKSNYIEKN
jgi:hypothetical protein